ncbi:MAG TPA: DUF4019 domain-containing protein [bacterium]|nr:DUF4019 domain-containing protein [bacterium]HPN31882.1 DUF4019 domain-containing protein [bacterium]
MKLIKRILIMITASAMLISCGSKKSDTVNKSESKEVKEAEENAAESAEKWLELLDEKKYVESWGEAAEIFKKAAPEENWIKMLNAFRDPLGKLETRELKKTRYSKTMPGAPDGDYMELKYLSSFENKKEGIETVILMKDKNDKPEKWRVSGYFIK